jgi:hypothetical protein
MKSGKKEHAISRTTRKVSVLSQIFDPSRVELPEQFWSLYHTTRMIIDGLN